MLYRPEFHEPLTETAWDEAAVRARVERIADEHFATYDPETLWPSAEWDAEEARLPLTTLYSGASGIAWALARLGRDAAAIASRALEAWRETSDYEESSEPPAHTHASLYFGETGPLVVAWLLGDGSLEDDLFARVRENVDASTNELMWGQTGTMIVAGAAYERTGDVRWKDVRGDSARVLLERRDEEGLWPPLRSGRSLGAAHGASTMAAVLGEGAEVTAAALAKYAVVEDGLANWPPAAGSELAHARDGKIRLQWCHGAPGIVTSAVDYLDEELLLAGAELAWRAGPLGAEQGYGLCHGTAGSGYAFLKVFERTGDDQWLERGRRFAMHALEQVDRLPPRYSLMTGSIGAALFANDCAEARATFPIVDVL